MLSDLPSLCFFPLALLRTKLTGTEPLQAAEEVANILLDYQLSSPQDVDHNSVTMVCMRVTV